MKWKFRIAFAISMAVFLVACSGRSSNPSTTQPSAAIRQIPGCIPGILAKASAAADSFSYEFTDRLVVNFILPDNCTPDSVRFVVTCTVSNDTVFIVATDTATVNERCPCNYLVQGALEGLPLDRYVVICTRIDNGVESLAYSRYVIRNGAGASGSEVVYENSFENPIDTAGWTGYGKLEFRSDAPPGGGKQSLYVSGGCFVPHASLRLGRVLQDSRYVLRFWGKNLGIGGGVGLSTAESPSASVGSTVAAGDTAWEFFQSADTLSSPAGSTLRIEMSAGGIVWSAMLVDRLEVVRIE